MKCKYFDDLQPSFTDGSVNINFPIFNAKSLSTRIDSDKLITKVYT
jgi:hypothetical protein